MNPTIHPTTGMVAYIDSVKFDLDVESEHSVSVSGLDKLLQRWAL